jgi:hypothetical protein
MIFCPRSGQLSDGVAATPFKGCAKRIEKKRVEKL